MTSLTGAKKFQETYWARDPDEVDDILNNDLPSHGGIVRLRPGSYTDSDWSQRIDVPDNDDSHYVIDMRGSDITLSTFSPTTAYILKPASSTPSQRSIEFYGPKIMDVSSVTNPPGFLQLDDVENSCIYVPGGRGAVDFIYKNVQTQSSGHMNRVYSEWRSCDKGYVIEGSGISNDRCHYYGQIQNIKDIGVEVINGSWNNFWTQPENGQGSATGYDTDVDSSHNRIHLWHGGPSVPLDIEGFGNRIEMPQVNNQILAESNLFVRPGDIRAYYSNQQGAKKYSYHGFSFSVDWLGAGVLESNGDGSPSVNNFGLLLIPAGGSDGNSTQARTPSRIGNFAQGFIVYFHFKLNTTTNADYKLGYGTDDAGGDTEFIGFEADDANTNWSVVVQDGGGAREVDVELTAGNSDTGSAIGQDTSRHELVVHGDENRQVFSFDGEVVQTASQSISFGSPTRAFCEAINDGGTSARLDLHRMEYMGAE